MVDVVVVEVTTTGTARERNDEQVIQLASEHVNVSIKEVVTGEIEVSTITHLRDMVVAEDLISQHADIERVPIGHFVDAAPEMREEDGVLIIPIVEEIAVVERRLFLKEEVRIRRVTTTHRHQETVTLRQQEAVVQRQPAASSKDAVPLGGASIKPEEITP